MGKNKDLSDKSKPDKDKFKPVLLFLLFLSVLCLGILIFFLVSNEHTNKDLHSKLENLSENQTSLIENQNTIGIKLQKLEEINDTNASISLKIIALQEKIDTIETRLPVIDRIKTITNGLSEKVFSIISQISAFEKTMKTLSTKEEIAHFQEIINSLDEQVSSMGSEMKILEEDLSKGSESLKEYFSELKQDITDIETGMSDMSDKIVEINTDVKNMQNTEKEELAKKEEDEDEDEEAIQIYNDAILAFENKNYSLAKELFKKILTVESLDARIKYLWSAYYDDPIQAANDKTVPEIIKNLPDEYWETGEILKIQGLIALDIDDWETAEPLLDEYLQKNPDDGEVCVHFGKAAYDHTKIDKSISLLEKAIELQHTDASVYFTLGCAYEDKGNWESALGMYENCLKMNTSHVLGYYKAGKAAKELKEYKKAVKYFELFKTFKETPEGLLLLGECLLLSGKRTKANKWFDFIITEYPDSPEAQRAKELKK